MRFYCQMLRDCDVLELQADELCTFIGSKSRPTWLCATIEVASRVWASSLVGRRSSRNTTAVLNDVILRGRFAEFPLIATDGFAYYLAAILRLIGPACVYGHVIKTRRNDRVVRVDRRVKIGSDNRRKAALLASEDSETLNPSFVERLNLTIRHGSAYLRRRSPCHARCEAQLRGHTELLRCQCTAAQGVEVRARNQDARDAGRAGKHATALERRLHGTWSLPTYSCGGRAHSRGRPAQRNWHSRAPGVLLAARTTNGGLINSE